MKRYAAIFTLALTACAGSEEAPTTAPAPPPTPPVQEIDAAAAPEASAAYAVPSIASVILAEDCDGLNAVGVGGARRPGYSGRQRRKGTSSGAPSVPCTQSTLQIHFEGQGRESGAVSLKGIRIKSSSGDVVASVEARNPKLWAEQSYAVWDEVLPAGVDSKSSYDISVPKWNEVETAIGGSSYGHMFTVEVELTIGGQTATIVSPKVERKQRMMIRT